jgi:predicted ArsR family transcriptional regulator
VLTTQGYEPRLDDDVLLLANCPFDALAERHTELVCGVNQCFVQGVADGLESRARRLPRARAGPVLREGAPGVATEGQPRALA